LDSKINNLNKREGKGKRKGEPELILTWSGTPTL
jgi:hypothetical protein